MHVAPVNIQALLINEVIPQLKKWLNSNKKIYINDCGSLTGKINGIILLEPHLWLEAQKTGKIPKGIPTIIDGADELENWTREQLTLSLTPTDWQAQINLAPPLHQLIQTSYTQLSFSIWQHPVNPYNCYQLNPKERDILVDLGYILQKSNLITPKIAEFWQMWQRENCLAWVSISRSADKFTLHVAPKELASSLNKIWQRQPTVIIGSCLDTETQANTYKQKIGLPDLLSLKFNPDRQQDLINIYLPDALPLPNTSQFQPILVEKIIELVTNYTAKQPIIILVEDTPLKAQVGSILAANFGSKVQVESQTIAQDGILISGWEFWQKHQQQISSPQLLIIATLPIPSLENPLVAARVAYYKQHRQDWFRLYLLPSAIKTLQKSVLPLRESQGIVAILDNRLNHRSYGKHMLQALQPYRQIFSPLPPWVDQQLNAVSAQE
ncbi:MAG: ATP-dependent DNA helicase [Cyanobacteria bacterium J083]|nr:MAG: ATP-dependent DNA helicase [Cyanobacteria bacterium J083]